MKKLLLACSFLSAVSLSQITLAKPISIICVDVKTYEVLKLVTDENWTEIIGRGGNEHGHEEFKDPFVLKCNTPMKSKETKRCEGPILTKTEGNFSYSLNGELSKHYNGEIDLKFKGVLKMDAHEVDLDWLSYFLSFFGVIKYHKMDTFTCTL